MIGPIGWKEFDDRQTDDRQMTDRRQMTDDRQTDKSNPSVSYDTFAGFAGLINKVKLKQQIKKTIIISSVEGIKQINKVVHVFPPPKKKK